MKSDNKTPLHSSFYDSQVKNTIPYYDCFHQETILLVRAMKIEPRVWLDTGCGTGTLVEKAAKIFPETKFILSDPSAEMLSLAREKLKEYQDRIIISEPAGSKEIKMPKSEKPDVITAIQSHHYLSRENRRNAVKKCFNLLRNDGVFITFENIRPLTEKGIEIGKSYWSNFQLSCGKSPEAALNHLARFDKEFFPITVTGHIKLLKSCGFKTVELFWYSYMQAGFYAIK
jgi:tRNA (cmo5U34)-methyltransferase